MGTAHAAIYARISQDSTGEAAGVARQLDACRKQAGPGAAEYVDNDCSAFSGARRPQFERLLTDVQAGRISEIHVWATDRLYRRLSDLERLVEALADVPVVAVKSGRVDLSTADGRLNARLLGSVAQHSSEKSGERIGAARAQAREQGRYATAVRPFGWDKVGGQWQMIPAEAEAVKAAYRDVLAGRSLRSIAAEWRAAGFIGTRGGTITSPQVRSALMSGRQAGIITYKGEPTPHEIADGLALVDRETWLQVRAVLSDPKRRMNPGRPAHTLLSGIVTCGKCGARMHSTTITAHATKKTRRMYVCIPGNKHLSRALEDVDGPILALVARRVAQQADALADRATVAEDGSATVAQLEARLADLAELARQGLLAPADYAAVATGLRADIDAARAATVPTTEAAGLGMLEGVQDVEAEIRRLVDTDPDAARGIIRRMFASITVLPGGRGRKPTPADLAYEWAA